MDMVLHKTKSFTISFLTLLKRFWYVALILIAIIAYFVYQSQQNAAASTVQKYTVKRETLKNVLALSGKIDAEEKVSLHFQSGGRLAWVGVKVGDTVSQYQTIATLDQRQLQKNIEKYLNLYVRERLDFDGNYDTNGDGSLGLTQELRNVARRTYDQSQLDLNNSVLDVELQTISKEYASLYSPIDGIVTKVGAQAAGMNVSITDTYEVINPNTIYFAISADQTEVVDLKEGMKGVITLDAFPDTTFSGTISSISFTPITNETGTVYEVKMLVNPSAVSNYRLGMTGDVEFTLEEFPNVVVVPFEYIVDEDEKQYVFKQVNGKQEKVEVETNNEYEGLVEVTKGVTEGDVIYEPAV
jgi:RND family efflux transporter MFP subunit